MFPTAAADRPSFMRSPLHFDGPVAAIRALVFVVFAEAASHRRRIREDVVEEERAEDEEDEACELKTAEAFPADHEREAPNADAA